MEIVLGDDQLTVDKLIETLKQLSFEGNGNYTFVIECKHSVKMTDAIEMTHVAKDDYNKTIRFF